MSTYIDLHIQNGDLVFDDDNNECYITDRAVIAQDIMHAILENGLAHLLIAERSPSGIADIKTQISLLVEDDVRIMPGTVRIERQNDEYWLLADTIEFGPISSVFNITGGSNG